MKFIKNYICFFIILFSFNSYGQVKLNALDYKETPNYLHLEDVSIDSLKSKNYVLLERMLPKNYVKDASEDYTEIIQKVLNNNTRVQFPPFPLLINPNGLRISNYANLYFPKGSKLIMQPNDKERFPVLHILNSSHITLLNPVIVGDRENHKGEKGEWGAGISILGVSKDIKILNAKISSTWGDGISIGNRREKVPSDIKMVNIVVDKAYRNGVSITAGQNISLKNALLTNSNYNGVKIEANSSVVGPIKNILLENINTFNCYNNGIGFGGFSKLIGKKDSRIELTIINPHDVGSGRGLSFGMVSHSKRTKNKYPVEGYIKVFNPKWENNRLNNFHKLLFYENLPNVEIHGASNELKAEIKKRYHKDRQIIFK